MTQKILITGSSGMLAYDLARVWSKAGYEVAGLSHAELDVTQASQVREVVDGLKPDIVFLTPGTGVDACEENPAVGFRLHTWSAELMAQACEQVGAQMVYISTCGLFGDTVRENSEYDPVELKTQYARSKFLGEQATQLYCSKSFVIRPGWLFGGTPEHNRNFVYQRYVEARQKPLLQSANDKIGCPTNTGDMADKILELVESQQYGLYNVASSGMASRYEYVKQIVDAFGLDNTVEPVDSSAYARSAPVPDCEVLSGLNLQFLGLAPMPPWQEAIQRYVAHLKKLDTALS